MTRLLTISIVTISLGLSAVPCARPAPMHPVSHDCCMKDCDAEMTAAPQAVPRPAPSPLDCCVLAAARDVAVLTPVVSVHVTWLAVLHALPVLDVAAANPAPANERAARARSAPRSAPAAALLI